MDVKTIKVLKILCYKLDINIDNRLGIPVAGATLPVIAFLLLGIYGKNVFLILSTIILGIGHIGIHLNHKKEL